MIVWDCKASHGFLYRTKPSSPTGFGPLYHLITFFTLTHMLFMKPKPHCFRITEDNLISKAFSFLIKSLRFLSYLLILGFKCSQYVACHQRNKKDSTGKDITRKKRWEIHQGHKMTVEE